MQELIIEKDIDVDNTEEVAIKRGTQSEFSERQKTFSFTGTAGVNRQLFDTTTSYNVFTLFIDNEIIDVFVVETNRYA